MKIIPKILITLIFAASAAFLFGPIGGFIGAVVGYYFSAALVAQRIKDNSKKDQK